MTQTLMEYEAEAFKQGRAADRFAITATRLASHHKMLIGITVPGEHERHIRDCECPTGSAWRIHQIAHDYITTATTKGAS